MKADFDINVTHDDARAVVRIRGELDLDTAPRLSEEIATLASRGVSAVTVDLAHLDFIDSSGLTALITGLKRLRDNGGDMTLRSPTPTTLKVFEITGLTRVFAISDETL